MKFTRLEDSGRVVYMEGTRRLKVPSHDACKERVYKLLEEVHGDTRHPIAERFWVERAREIGDPDEMKAAWAAETWQRLGVAWDELTTPPAVVTDDDVFSSFGV